MRSKITQKIVNETDDKVKEKVNVFADMTILDSWLEKHKNEEIDAIVEKDIKFFDLLAEYFYYEDNGYLEVYVSKDNLFTIQRQLGCEYMLVPKMNDLSIKEIINYWTVDNRDKLTGASLEDCFLQYLRIKLLSFCE